MAKPQDADAPPAAPAPEAPAKAKMFPATQPDSYESTRPDFSRHIGDFVRDQIHDQIDVQRQVWTSPARLRLADAGWLVPLGGITAGLFATDRQYSASLPQDPATVHHYKTVSELGLAGLAGASAGLYLFSFPAHNPHWRETGFLATEAALNSWIAAETLKYSFRRQRPYQGDGSGAFLGGGTSFPSEQSAAAWSIAGVIAHEYPGTLPNLFAYGMASAVSFSRIRGRQHFPSDVLVGSALGYLAARTVYTRHHDPELGGGSWESPRGFLTGDGPPSPAHMGSPYVPLDSWVYPALERLAALGYVNTAILGLRPWTRLECARLLGEASEHQADGDAPADAQDLYAALAREFGPEVDPTEMATVHAQVESVYARATGIAGTPLTDNLHFGQTVVNDFGRPFEPGFNSAAGASAWTTAGPFVVYVRGEYESAPSAPSLPVSTLDLITSIDGLPANPPSMPVSAVSRFRLLDAYVGMNLGNWQFSFGRQSLWWGPGTDGALLITNNAQPLDRMFRINRVSPVELPGVLGYLGDMRMEFFIGQLSGQQFLNNSGVFISGTQGTYGQSLHPQPFLSGGKISFKFTPNFEFSISKTTIFGGPGNPLTPKTFLQSTLGVHVNGEASGDGRSAIDFSYRVPGMRNWLSIYGEGFAEDEISPLTEAHKSAWQGGLYLARIPRISKLDLRVEGGFTDPVDFDQCNACFYHNFQYVSGYTNGGELIGTWIGRAAQGEAVSSNYWFSPQKKIGIEARHRKIDAQYLPQGGTQNDVAVNADFFTRAGFRFSGMLQYERWQIPVLAANRQSNITASFQIAYWPKVRGK